ncbi:site-specific DNA-methyltransferase [Paenibacillus tianjinensis]|uniref:Methyltransferase n=1 Tax=Paenibacillus tianjinensis TaxID=2810347 RepID=A0ABX7LLS0_9BACL|nr:site-specific DNA-methyltransferase [Paenibacillus tianjinensis]QSF47863.1 site-specific DNA-methyltransferase [Paenibacillus tianjinensis]
MYQFDCLQGLKLLPDKCINTCVTSPPYWGLRDYGVDGQLGLEDSPDTYVESLLQVFEEVERVLRDDGTLWVNLGDTYVRRPQKTSNPDKNSGFQKGQTSESARDKRKIPEGLKIKDMVGIPWRVAFALQATGWYLRSDIIWQKRNFTPENVPDRPTKAHEYIFLLSKNKKYYYDAESVMEDTVDGLGKRRRRSVWTVSSSTFKGAHFATFPEELITPCILSGCPENGVVLDPFMGAGTTALVAAKNDRNFIGFELNHEYIEIANKRLEHISS